MVTRFVDFERSKLFEEVWAHPLSHLGVLYGVSGATVRQAAHAMKLPLPAMGHWARAARGNAAAKPKLPETTAPLTYRHTWHETDDAEELSRRPTPAPQPRQAAKLAAMPRLAASLDECLPLVRQLAARLKAGYKDSRHWPAVRERWAFEVAVAPENQLRALLTLDRLVKYCKASGLELVADDKGKNPTHFVVEETKVRMRIFESARRHANPLTPAERSKLKSNPAALPYRMQYVYRGTNVLRLEVQVLPGGWTDLSLEEGPGTPLAEQLSGVPTQIREAVRRIRLRDDICSKEKVLAEEGRAALARRQALKTAELAKLAHFEALAERLERAKRLRALTSALATSKVLQADSAERELAWLLTAADWLDPTVQGRWPAVDDAHVLT